MRTRARVSPVAAPARKAWPRARGGGRVRAYARTRVRVCVPAYRVYAYARTRVRTYRVPAYVREAPATRRQPRRCPKIAQFCRSRRFWAAFGGSIGVAVLRRRKSAYSAPVAAGHSPAGPVLTPPTDTGGGPPAAVTAPRRGRATGLFGRRRASLQVGALFRACDAGGMAAVFRYAAACSGDGGTALQSPAARSGGWAAGRGRLGREGHASGRGSTWPIEREGGAGGIHRRPLRANVTGAVISAVICTVIHSGIRTDTPRITNGVQSVTESRAGLGNVSRTP